MTVCNISIRFFVGLSTPIFTLDECFHFLFTSRLGLKFQKCNEQDLILIKGNRLETIFAHHFIIVHKFLTPILISLRTLQDIDYIKEKIISHWIMINFQIKISEAIKLHVYVFTAPERQRQKRLLS